MREDGQSKSEIRYCNNVTPLRRRISSKGNEEVKPLMKAAVGKTDEGLNSKKKEDRQRQQTIIGVDDK